MKVCIESNIASGKSRIVSLLKDIFQSNRSIFVSNCINNWNCETLLNNYYKDTGRYAFLLELVATVDKTRPMPNKQLIFIDQGRESIKECYIETLYKMKYISKLEYETYNKIYNLLEPDEIDLYIYVQTNPAECYTRILARKNKTEQNITLNYIAELHKQYEKLMENKFVYTISDINISKERLIEELAEVCPKLKQFIKFV